MLNSVYRNKVSSDPVYLINGRDDPKLKEAYELNTISDAAIHIFCSQIGEDYRAIIHRKIMPYMSGLNGISLKELQALMAVDFHGRPMAAHEIAKNLRYSPSKVSRVVKTLEHAGFLRRKRKEVGTRSTTVVLTPKGLDLAEQYRWKFAACFNKMSENLGLEMTEAERRGALKLLMKLRERSHQFRTC